jgi:hypothetical protein
VPKKAIRFITVSIFTLTILAIGLLFYAPERIFRPQRRVHKQTRMVIPPVWTPEGSYDEGYLADRLA